MLPGHEDPVDGADFYAQVESRLQVYGARLQASTGLLGTLRVPPEPAPEPGRGLGSILGRLRRPRPRQEDIWVRYEDAVGRLRALGHHLDMLDRERVLLGNDAIAIQRDLLAAACRLHAVESSLTKAGLEECPILEWERARCQAIRARLEDLAALNREDTDLIEDLRTSLANLLIDGESVLASLDEIRTEAGNATIANPGRPRGDSGLRALGDSLDMVFRQRDESVVVATRRVDALDERLRRLDAEGRARREALDEVLRTLDSTEADPNG